MENSHLTICYQTCRRESRFEWFYDSLLREMRDTQLQVKVVVVDFHAQEIWPPCGPIIVVPPKPTVWQGPHRLTSEDYFAAANSRNTGLCYAPDGWIAYVDDLSVMMPGWLSCIQDAMRGHYIVLGAYKKVKNLIVEDGVAKSYTEFEAGIDTRWHRGANCPVVAHGSWLYGCSLAAPVEALLTVGGFPEICDGMGFEDVIAGIVLGNAGYTFRYDRRMLTLESEELHHVEKPFKRCDKGRSPDDKSHAALNLAHNGCRYFVNYHEGGIRVLRDKILAGEPFPACQIPDRDWFDGQLISEL